MTIFGDDAKHISRVMRMKIGDEIICSDGENTTVRCEIIDLSDHVVAKVIELISSETELPVKVTIAQALPKADKLEYVVQKGTELGATAFIPFAATRSVVKWDEKKANRKVDRLRKIAKEAAEQSWREKIPEILNVHSFSELKETFSNYHAVIVASEEAAKQKETSKFRATLSTIKDGDSLLIIVGPEGGWTKEEAETLREEGAILCGFGPRILRTETAALYALAAISYHFEL